MKPVKNVVFAALLVSTIAFNTLAGDIDVPGAPAPPPPPRMTAEVDETIPATNIDPEEALVEPADTLFFEVLAALLSVY